jgi:hypothetical protein
VQARHVVGDSPRCIVLGDLNDDESLDLIIANGESDDVSVLLNALPKSMHPKAKAHLHEIWQAAMT